VLHFNVTAHPRLNGPPNRFSKPFLSTPHRSIYCEIVIGSMEKSFASKWKSWTRRSSALHVLLGNAHTWNA
jgi:hypothetical protein